MTLPVFLPQPAPKDATPWTILSWGSAPLHGVSQSLRQRPLGRRHLSWGFVAPTALQEERVHVRPVSRLRLPGCAGNLPRGPTLPATVSLAGFLSLSATFFLSPPSCHFQAGNARGVSPSGVCSFQEAPATHRRRYALLTFLPRVALPPVLGGGIRGRADRIPRMSRRNAFHRLQGLRLRWKSVRITQPLLMSE
jgi:hypothetical protein